MGDHATDVNGQVLLQLSTQTGSEVQGWLPGGHLYSDLLALLHVYLGSRLDGFTFRMEDQRSYESHGDGLQSEDGLIHTFDVQASSSGLGMVLLDTLTGSGLHPASRAFLRPGA